MKLFRAFTLIELMISVSLFSIVMLIVGTAYLNLVNIDRQTRASNDAVNNLSFAIDSMSRTIRTGVNYCGTGMYCSATVFTFTDSDGCTDSFQLSSGQLVQSKSGSNPACTPSFTNVPLTDSRVTIDALNFTTYGLAKGDALQPTVIINLHATVQAGTKYASSFSLETSATERGIDL